MMEADLWKVKSAAIDLEVTNATLSAESCVITLARQALEEKLGSLPH